jgi:hypothetical protein
VEAQLPAGATVMVCPIGCAVSSTGQGVLVAIQAPAGAPVRAGVAQGVQSREVPNSQAGEQKEPRLRRQQEQLMVLARRLAGVMP